MLSNLKSNKKSRKRVGRGQASGTGKTAGRGENGQKSRSGGKVRIGFEGGQTPLYRRLPKRGFTNARFKKEYAIINLDALNIFENDTVVTPELLLEKRVVRHEKDGIKILGNGKLEKKLVVKAHKFSKSALAAIEASKGKCEVI